MSDLPDGWEWATLGELGDWYGGGTPSKSNPSYWENGNIPWVSPKDMSSTAVSATTNRITELALENSTTRVVPSGALVFVVRSGILVRKFPVAVLKVDATLNQDMKAICPNWSINSLWLAYFLQSRESKILAEYRKAGTTVASLDATRLAKMPVPLPPLAEQRRIVDVLDDQLSRLKSGRAQVDHLLRRVNGFRDNVYTSATSGKLESGTSAGCADSPVYAGVVDGDLPQLPSAWAWRRLGEIADVVGGVTKDGKKQSDASVPKVPYLRVANVQRARIELNDVATIRVDPAKARSLELQEGDVLLNEGGDRDKLGRGWVWEGQIPGCIHQNHVFRIRIRGNVLDPKLLAWHANGFGKEWFFRNGKQSTNLASISLSTMKLLPVPVPPAEEQDSLVKVADEQLSMLDSVEQRLLRAQRRGDHLHQSLLREAFAGRLVPQDPDDEPASVLLERIRDERESASKTKTPRKKQTKKSRTAEVQHDKEVDPSAPPPGVPGKGTQDALELDL